MVVPKLTTYPLMVCRDCFDVISGDTSSWCLYMTEAEHKKREDEINRKIKELNGYVEINPDGAHHDFAKYSCELCGSPLAGERFEVTVFED